ncbi:MAG: hypothetical protein MJZ30_09405 [Paludibacteraceae bacterium]|nr:hypothetical protein [Paludibacteraceae bacterium]
MIKLKDKTATDIFFMGRSVKKAIHKGVVIFEEKENFSDDTARQLLGKDWRMPTRAEYQELINSCDWTWKTIEGINGYEVKSRSNGNSIFLRAGGYKANNDHHFIGVVGMFWASEVYGNTGSWFLQFRNDSIIVSQYNRNYGRTIRPVSETKGIDLGLSVRWADCNLSATTPTDYGDYYQWADSEIKTSYTAINNVYYIDGAYRKYNSKDKLTTLELVNTDPLIKRVPLWHFVKKHFNESSKTLDIKKILLKDVEIDNLIDKLWQVTESRVLDVSHFNYKYISDNQQLKDKLLNKGWVLHNGGYGILRLTRLGEFILN